ncbi:MAG: hypothetical protein ACFCUE_05315 [Candidatus Bathyarchaeia archaeon]
MDKNVKKNVLIIVLVVFLCFSALLNIFYMVRNQVLDQQDNGLRFSGRLIRNQTNIDYHFKPSSELAPSVNFWVT